MSTTFNALKLQNKYERHFHLTGSNTNMVSMYSCFLAEEFNRLLAPKTETKKPFVASCSYLFRKFPRIFAAINWYSDTALALNYSKAPYEGFN